MSNKETTIDEDFKVSILVQEMKKVKHDAKLPYDLTMDMVTSTMETYYQLRLLEMDLEGYNLVLRKFPDYLPNVHSIEGKENFVFWVSTNPQLLSDEFPFNPDNFRSQVVLVNDKTEEVWREMGVQYWLEPKEMVKPVPGSQEALDYAKIYAHKMLSEEQIEELINFLTT